MNKICVIGFQARSFFTALLISAGTLCSFSSLVMAADAGSSTLSKPNAVSIELLGRAIYYSVNFDHSFSDSTAAGIGISYLSASGTSNDTYTSITYSLLILPTYFNYYFQPGLHRGFLTGGLDLIVASASVTEASSNSNYSGSGFGVLPTLGGGYEYRGDGGFLFRVAPYLVIGRIVIVRIGLSFGLTF